jgi:hypothetical protein
MMHVVLVLFVLAAVLLALVLAPLSITKALLGDSRLTRRSFRRKVAGHAPDPPDLDFPFTHLP